MEENISIADMPALRFIDKLKARAGKLKTKAEGNVLEVSEGKNKVSFTANSNELPDGTYTLFVDIKAGEETKTYACIADNPDFNILSRYKIEERVARFAHGIFWGNEVLMKLALGA